MNEVTTSVDLRPTQDLFVNIKAQLDPSARVLTWTFTSIDAKTGLPPEDAGIGFLLPGAEGGVSFTVMPQPGLPSGTEVSDQGAVVFDIADPVPTGVWINTLDNTVPTSGVLALEPLQTSASFPVAWTGSDNESGIGDFTVFVSDNGGPFTAWLTHATDPSGTFPGVDGHTYSFYSIARDLAGNTEPPKTAAEATTQVQVAPKRP
jgi:hypothetical protein